jgi:hypothetical protein
VWPKQGWTRKLLKVGHEVEEKYKCLHWYCHTMGRMIYEIFNWRGGVQWQIAEKSGHDGRGSCGDAVSELSTERSHYASLFGKIRVANIELDRNRNYRTESITATYSGRPGCNDWEFSWVSSDSAAKCSDSAPIRKLPSTFPIHYSNPPLIRSIGGRPSELSDNPEWRSKR